MFKAIFFKIYIYIYLRTFKFILCQHWVWSTQNTKFSFIVENNCFAVLMTIKSTWRRYERKIVVKKLKPLSVL